MARGHSRPQQPLHQPPPTSIDTLDSLTKAAPRELQASTPIIPLRLAPTQIHFFPTLNEKIQLFFLLHLNFFEVLLIFAESCGVLEDFAALI